MSIFRILLSTALLLGAASAAADFELFKDYNYSDAVYSVDTVKVKPSAGDKYLEGLKATWVSAAEIQKKLGFIEDYAIYSSITPQLGHFNLMLVTKFKNMEAMQPNKARRDALMKEMGKAKMKEGNKRALEEYPELREITGSYIVNEVLMK